VSLRKETTHSLRRCCKSSFHRRFGKANAETFARKEGKGGKEGKEGKERKGKERKGKERKGKERKGKESLVY